jgi:hypothetical protein
MSFVNNNAFITCLMKLFLCNAQAAQAMIMHVSQLQWPMVAREFMTVGAASFVNSNVIVNLYRVKLKKKGTKNEN